MKAVSTFWNQATPCAVMTVAVLCMASPPPSAFAAEKDAYEEIVVTGSRIAPDSNVVNSSPVSVVGADEFLYQGVVRVEDLLNDLPQVYAGQTTGISNGATGTATVNLRGLGSVRTLVLIDGNRLGQGSPLGGAIAADINQIPAAMIERVEVLTGGASSVYGSDAVAGVINFILKKDFEGVALDYQKSYYTHKNSNTAIQNLVRATGFTVPTGSVSDGDADSWSILLGAGLADGKGNVTAYLTYRNIKPVLQGSRDYSTCDLANGGPDDPFECGGSSTLPDGRFTDFGSTASLNAGSFDYIVGGANGDEFVDRNGLRYNYNPLNYYQRPDEHYNGGFSGYYQISERVEAHMSLFFSDNRTVSQIAPSGNFFVTDTLSCGNPFLSAQQFALICTAFGLGVDDVFGGAGNATEDAGLYIGRRNVEGGPRQQDLRHTSYRFLAGIRGDINEAWGYDLTLQQSEVSMENTYLNDLSTTRIIRALDVTTDSNGDPVCQSVVDGYDLECVPWNLFEAGAVTQAAIDYLVLPLFARGTTDQKVVTAFVTGSDLGNSGSSVVFGYEYRSENLDFSPDNGFQSGDGAGQGGPTNPVRGGYDVTEYFGEARFPLADDKLTIDLGWRGSDYSTGEKTNTYKVGLGWLLGESVKLRISNQQSVRHANIRELFRPVGIGLFNMDTDPCSGALMANDDGVMVTAAGRTLEQCMRTGVTAGRFGTIADSPAGQYNEITGGNPNLRPETSDTVTFGIVWAPSAFTLSLDYFDITVDDAIASINSETILNKCLDTGEVRFCDVITRGATTETLWIGDDNIRSLDVNIGFFATKGFDLNFKYDLNMDNGYSIKFNNSTTLISEWQQQEFAGEPTESCEGLWGGTCGDPTPDFQNVFRATLTTPSNNLAISLAWRHISGVTDIGDLESATNFNDVNYLDTAVIWSPAEQVSLRLGMNNLLDEEPPLASDSADFGNGNTFPGTYDALGRYVFFGAGFKF